MKTIIAVSFLFFIVSASNNEPQASDKCTSQTVAIPLPTESQRFNQKEIMERKKDGYHPYAEDLKEMFRKRNKSGDKIKDLETEIADLKSKLFEDPHVDLLDQVKNKKIYSLKFIERNLSLSRLAELHVMLSS